MLSSLGSQELHKKYYRYIRSGNHIFICIRIYIYIYIFICVCVVCPCANIIYRSPGVFVWSFPIMSPIPSKHSSTLNPYLVSIQTHSILVMRAIRLSQLWHAMHQFHLIQTSQFWCHPCGLSPVYGWLCELVPSARLGRPDEVIPAPVSDPNNQVVWTMATADTMQCSRQYLVELIEILDLYRLCRIGISRLYVIAFFCWPVITST